MIAAAPHWAPQPPSRVIANLHQLVGKYYTRKVVHHGATPLGVDWTCVATQELRFLQLMKLDRWPTTCSLTDLGCGYGALLGYLGKNHRETEFDYLGIDLSAAMIECARQTWPAVPNSQFAVDARIPRIADYAVASGLFNVNLWCDAPSWEAFVADTLSQLHHASRRGFAVNFLASESSNALRGLYRASPARWVSYCEEELHSDVEVIDDYGLDEFTLLVRTPAALCEGRALARQ